MIQAPPELAGKHPPPSTFVDVACASICAPAHHDFAHIMVLVGYGSDSDADEQPMVVTPENDDAFGIHSLPVAKKPRLDNALTIVDAAPDVLAEVC